MYICFDVGIAFVHVWDLHFSGVEVTYIYCYSITRKRCPAHVLPMYVFAVWVHIKDESQTCITHSEGVWWELSKRILTIEIEWNWYFGILKESRLWPTPCHGEEQVHGLALREISFIVALGAYQSAFRLWPWFSPTGCRLGTLWLLLGQTI